ncbi:Signal recognition particle receptor subunit beta [Thelohanellus kitauei]|uniref:Signal recognition particle receptor subunit beta n=1 Tax=Thelohanellus kitauei TaxID=669202 RepID=A0A0C2MGD9_THEKT|nr:Signal recognition particle receptor subunit beta [Thelohanellus kitauei]
MQQIPMDLVSILPFVVSLVILVVASLVIYRYWFRERPYTLLVVGLSGSGKTYISFAAITKDPPMTVTSFVPNIYDYKCLGSKKSIRVIDIPGHERIRSQLFHKYKSMATTILFLIDAVTLKQQSETVTSFLYQVMNDRILRKNKVKIILGFNYKDLDDKQKVPIDDLVKTMQFLMHLVKKSMDSYIMAMSNNVDKNPNTDAITDLSSLEAIEMDRSKFMDLLEHI